MPSLSTGKEFRFYYYTKLYSETVLFYKTELEFELVRSWDRKTGDRGTIFRSPNGAGFIEILEGDGIPVIEGAIYIEVDDVDTVYERAVAKNLNITQALFDTTYGHRSFKIKDPVGMTIGFFKYND